MISNSNQLIALALSGGGIRAMVFHLGVLRFLAEHDALERVSHISSVSGGSLVLGLLLQNNKMQWPTSAQYLTHSLPVMRKKLCTQSLISGMVSQLKSLKITDWGCWFSRANLLAYALRDKWGVTATLSQLPDNPEWSINATTAETGKRFRFKQKDFGDYVLGYARSDDFPLANALAVSAAFPGAIGPLTISAEQYQWKKWQWNESVENAKCILPAYANLHLYDGGIYDNLGLEPFFDAGRGVIKTVLPQGTAIIVSDAGAPLMQGFSFSRLNPWRMKRVADIMSGQSRSLRIRTFINYLKKEKGRGAYFYIGKSISSGSPCASAAFAANFPTTLRKLTELEFDTILNHGYLVANKFYRQFDHSESRADSI
ncbi:patatin-like phospholipase family protein [Serratia microhaemolytica]|uniref:patatin-like phospholipase family protein n=1 Tax=Serratia microhaemolytica TaxID=2675110 RepID=UPI0019815747|nr:patatin-like phospholipase family protein [Serratia microhaemolytica]